MIYCEWRKILIEKREKMNFKRDLTIRQQNALKEIGIESEDKNYSPEEIRHCLNEICSHVMNQSSKNGDISREMAKYNDISNILMKNENQIGI